MLRRLTLLLFLIVASCCFALATEFTSLSGPYLGQTPPESTPRLFAPGVVSVWEDFEHSAAVFSPDGTEVFWCTVKDRYDPAATEWLERLYTTRLVEGYWAEPEVAAFVADFEVPVGRPVFSPDGGRLYVEYFRNAPRESDADIFFVERVEGEWSEPVRLPSGINTTLCERIHCVTADGSMYFTRGLMSSQESVFVAHFVDGSFTRPEQLGAPFDMDGHELAIAVAADESFALIGITRTGAEDILYVTYRNPDGTWTDRIRAPYRCGGFLSLSPDGEYLFFLGDGIFWVDTSFVEDLKPAHLR